MSRSTEIKVLREELEELINQLEDAMADVELSKQEKDHASEIAYRLNDGLTELDYFIGGLDAKDEQEYYDEDGNPEAEDDSKDGSIW